MVGEAPGIKEAMAFSGPSITEMHELLLSMQKNLECPICLEVMKEPVSTKCAHIFCRFCVFKLLSQKKGVTQCPLCNAKVTKRSLWEDVRFKQVIEGVLQTICAFEHDTGIKFTGDPCFPKRALETVSSSVPQKNKSIVDSKGYRNRLKSIKERKKENTTRGKNSSLPLANGSVPRYSLRKKRNSKKTIVFEIGSDSSEDLLKKTGAVECVDFGSGSLSQDSDGNGKKQSSSLCHMKLSEPSTEDVASLDILGACDLLEEGLGSTEVSVLVNTGNSEVVEENVAVEKCQQLSFQDPCMQQHDNKSSPKQENDSCSLLTREQLIGEATKPTTGAGHGAEKVDVVLPAGSAQICSIPPENNEQLLQSQAPPDSPLSQVSGKRLRQSIQKVNEWLYKTKGIPSPKPLRDAHTKEAQTEELVQNLDSYLLEADSRISQKTEQMKDLGEFIVECESDRQLSKGVASKIEDKIFGRTYRRERRSTSLLNEKETNQIPAEEGIAINTKSHDTPVRKILMRKRKAISMLTPEDFIKRQDIKVSSKRPDGVEDRPLEEGGHNSSVNRSSVADPKKAMLPAESVKEGVSTLKTEAGKQTHNKSLPESSLCDSKNKKKTNSLSKKSRHTVNWVEAKEPGASVHLQCSAELQIDSYPSSEEPRDVVAGQMQARRSKRLQLWTEKACRRNEPAKRKREQVDEKDKGGKQRGSQEIKILHFPSTAEDDPVLLQGRLQKGMSCSDANLMGMKDDVSKACSNSAIPPDTLEVVENSLSSKQRIKGCSPCYTVPNTNSQGICSLPQFHPKAEQSTFEGKQFTEIPQSEKSGLSPKVPESDGFCIGDVTESCKIPKASNKVAGTLELNPETDDSELDTAFVQKIFSRCTRQSFLLHPSPIKESVAEIQKMSVEEQEDRTIGCVIKPTQSIDKISEQREEAVACEVTKNISVQSLNLGPGSCTSSFPEQNNGMEHLQVASEILSPNYTSTPGSATKNVRDESQLQSQKLGSEKGTSEELRRETSKTNSASKSLSVHCKTNFQDIHLNFLNETNANTVCFQETGPEGAENKMLPYSSQPELMHLHPESCQLPPPELNEKQNNTMVQSPDSCSPGVPKCLASGENVEQSFDEELHNFPQLLETPKSLHSPAVKGSKCSSTLWGMGRKDILTVFAKTAEQTLHGRDLDSSNSSKSSKCEEIVRSHRRLVQKLPSSEEEDSSEDEELPCFQALISDQLVNTPLQLRKKKTLALSSNSRNIPKSEDEDVSPSQQSQCSVNLFSSQSHESEDNFSKCCDSKFIIPAPISKEKLASPNRKENTTRPRSRMSGDGGQLKDGYQEHAELNTELNLGEETMDYDSEASHLEDSSGLSSQSETLTTQQKEFMQNNLKKLQQKMAILEAVLKEGSHSTAPKELLPTCKETDFVGGQTIPTSGVELDMKAKSGNLETTNLKEDLLEEVPATPDNPASNKNLEPVVQQLQNAGKTSKLRYGSKQNLGDFSPAGSVQGIPNSSSVSSSRSEGHTSICLAIGTARKSPHAMQVTDKVTDRSTVAMHKTHGEPSSSLAPIASCSAGNGKLKSSYLTCKNMSLVASGLNQCELRLVQKFANKTGSTWSNQFTEATTHVVMKTDGDLVCERTLKYFLGIAARKWVVSYHWIVQSLKEGRVINEVDFEVKGDVVNGRSHEGPKRARESLAGKIFQGLEICCYGPFTDMPSEQLEWMVELCGASLVKQPHLFAHASKSAAVVVVQPDAWVEVAACQEILLRCGATVVAREWVLDSVACYERQMFDNYIIQLV